MTCATCPRALTATEQSHGMRRCRVCRKTKPGHVLRSPRAGISLLTRAMKQQPQERRESFWTTAPREGWGNQVQAHRFPQVPYGPLLVSWTRDYF